MEMNHILVVEDDKEIREGVKIYLQRGYPSGDRGHYDAENGWNPDDDEAERKI